jgi:hypothetical protein
MSLDPEALYERWTPATSPWSPWVKPVIFIEIGRGRAERDAPPFTPADVSWAPPTVEEIPVEPEDYRSAPERRVEVTRRRAALVIDLPAVAATTVGLSLIERGYRPVPLFNGAVDAPTGHPIHAAGRLVADETERLVGAALPSHAPPAFLLDATRSEGSVIPGSYTGRWIVFPQDFPSARTLREQGIDRVIHVGRAEGPAEDLAHVLRGWQDGGLEIWSGPPPELRRIDVTLPPAYRSLWRRALALMSLHRNATGGFGAMVPLPAQGGGGG